MSRKNFILSIFLLFLLVATGTVQAQDEKYLLRNQFKQGSTASLIYNVTNTGVTTMNAMQFPIESSLSLIMQYQTVKVDNDVATIVAGIKKMLMNDPNIGGEKDVDLADQWGLDENQITIKINPLGKIIEAEDAPVSQSMQMQGMANAGQSYTQQNPFLLVPEEAIPIGYSWTEERPITFTAASKEMIVYTTYTLESVKEENGEQIAVIHTESTSFNEDVHVDPGASGQQMGLVKLQFTFKEYSTHGTGQIFFNLDQGRIERLENESDMVIDLSGKTSVHDAEQPTQFVMKFKVRAEGNVIDGLPEGIE